MIDRFTWKTLQFMESVNPNNTLQDLMDTMDPQFLHSEATARTNLHPRPLKEVLSTLMYFRF